MITMDVTIILELCLKVNSNTTHSQLLNVFIKLYFNISTYLYIYIYIFNRAYFIDNHKLYTILKCKYINTFINLTK